jgi:transposase
VLEKEYAKA